MSAVASILKAFEAPRASPAQPMRAQAAPRAEPAKPASALPATPANAEALGLGFAEPARFKRAEKDLTLSPPRTETKILSLSKIRADYAWNCRSKIDEQSEAFMELAESLKSGLQQPLKVTPARGADGFYDLVSGFRRFKGLNKIGCKQAMCIVAYYDDPIAATLDNLLENMHRERLRPFEVARVLSAVRSKGFTLHSIAKHVGLSTQHVGNLVRCHEKLIPPLKNVFQQSNETTLTELIHIAAMEPQEQLRRYEEISQRPAKPEISSGASSPPQDEPKVKKPKMRSREQVEDYLTDIHRSSAIRKLGRGKVLLDGEVREAVVSSIKWVLGEMDMPLVMGDES